MLQDWFVRADRLPADITEPPGLGQRILRGLLGFVLGGILGLVVTFVLAVAFILLAPGDSGVGTAIGIVFFLVPAGGLVGAILGALLLALDWRRSRRA